MLIYFFKRDYEVNFLTLIDSLRRCINELTFMNRINAKCRMCAQAKAHLLISLQIAVLYSICLITDNRHLLDTAGRSMVYSSGDVFIGSTTQRIYYCRNVSRGMQEMWQAHADKAMTNLSNEVKNCMEPATRIEGFVTVDQENVCGLYTITVQVISNADILLGAGVCRYVTCTFLRLTEYVPCNVFISCSEIWLLLTYFTIL